MGPKTQKTHAGELRRKDRRWRFAHFEKLKEQTRKAAAESVSEGRALTKPSGVRFLPLLTEQLLETAPATLAASTIVLSETLLTAQLPTHPPKGRLTFIFKTNLGICNGVLKLIIGK